MGSLLVKDVMQAALPLVIRSAIDSLTSGFRLAMACHPLLCASSVEGGASVINIGSMTSYFGVEVVPAAFT